MMKNGINFGYALQVMQENFADYRRNGEQNDKTTLREYVESQADSDPGFFRFLFNNDDIEDFADLDDEHKEEYKEFLNSCD